MKMNVNKLTKRQSDVLSFIRTYFIDEQSMPTCLDIAKNFGFKNANGGFEHIASLKRYGYLEGRAGKTPAYKLSNVKITIEDI